MRPAEDPDGAGMHLRRGPNQVESWLKVARRAGLAWAVKTTRAIGRSACTEATKMFMSLL